MKLQTDAADCELISDLSNDPDKRELFARLAEHLSDLATDVRKAIAKAEQENHRLPRAQR